MCFLKSKHSWLAAPIVWAAGIATLLTLWLTASPEWLERNFDNGGTSPVESATIGLFLLVIPFMWLVPPIRDRRHRAFWLTLFTVITLLAVVRELDLHKLLIPPSADPLATRGTPFKLRYLTNSHNPLSGRLIVLGGFAITIAVCGGTLLYFLRRLLRGLFKLHPVSWSVGFIGGTGLLIQFTDRMPATLRKDFGVNLSASASALFTVLEEGQEILLPIFAILAILQAHFIYNHEPDDARALAPFREM